MTLGLSESDEPALGDPASGASAPWGARVLQGRFSSAHFWPCSRRLARWGSADGGRPPKFLRGVRLNRVLARDNVDRIPALVVLAFDSHHIREDHADFQDCAIGQLVRRPRLGPGFEINLLGFHLPLTDWRNDLDHAEGDRPYRLRIIVPFLKTPKTLIPTDAFLRACRRRSESSATSTWGPRISSGTSSITRKSLGPRSSGTITNSGRTSRDSVWPKGRSTCSRIIVPRPPASRCSRSRT